LVIMKKVVLMWRLILWRKRATVEFGNVEKRRGAAVKFGDVFFRVLPP
jgi:hypothetical protein